MLARHLGDVHHLFVDRDRREAAREEIEADGRVLVQVAQRPKKERAPYLRRVRAFEIRGEIGRLLAGVSESKQLPTAAELARNRFIDRDRQLLIQSRSHDSGRRACVSQEPTYHFSPVHGLVASPATAQPSPGIVPFDKLMAGLDPDRRFRAVTTLCSVIEHARATWAYPDRIASRFVGARSLHPRLVRHHRLAPPGGGRYRA